MNVHVTPTSELETADCHAKRCPRPVMVIISEGLVRNLDPATIVACVKSERPHAGTTQTTVATIAGWLSSMDFQVGLDTRQCKKVGRAIRDWIALGLRNREIADEIAKEFPWSRIKSEGVSGYRSALRAMGLILGFSVQRG